METNSSIEKWKKNLVFANTRRGLSGSRRPMGSTFNQVVLVENLILIQDDSAIGTTAKGPTAKTQPYML